jgi:hypothetical protein
MGDESVWVKQGAPGKVASRRVRSECLDLMPWQPQEEGEEYALFFSVVAARDRSVPACWLVGLSWGTVDCGRQGKTSAGSEWGSAEPREVRYIPGSEYTLADQSRDSKAEGLIVGVSSWSPGGSRAACRICAGSCAQAVGAASSTGSPGGSHAWAVDAPCMAVVGDAVASSVRSPGPRGSASCGSSRDGLRGSGIWSPSLGRSSSTAIVPSGGGAALGWTGGCTSPGASEGAPGVSPSGTPSP